MTADDRVIVNALSPEQIVAMTLWGEARGQSKHLRAGIASVIQNRVQAQRPAWGLTPQAVCLAPFQFSCWISAGGSSNYDRVMELCKRLRDKVGTESFPILQECLTLAWHITGNELPDTVNGGLFYYSPAAMYPPGAVPKWADGKDPVASIDGTLFFVG